jgi:hypothetical protein
MSIPGMSTTMVTRYHGSLAYDDTQHYNIYYKTPHHILTHHRAMTDSSKSTNSTILNHEVWDQQQYQQPQFMQQQCQLTQQEMEQSLLLRHSELSWSCKIYTNDYKHSNMLA